MTSRSVLAAAAWLQERSGGNLEEIKKTTSDTRAWKALLDGKHVFAKWYPHIVSPWAEIERGIAGGELHGAIVPLRHVIECQDGILHLYDQAVGLNLAEKDAKVTFAALACGLRIQAVIAICQALAKICNQGYTIVDWYEGNMIYDFDENRIWLFDWDLCRPEKFFMLEMNSNYGTSRLMAPEEFVKGSLIDERSLVFNLGRYTLLTLPELADTLADLLARATHPRKASRFERVEDFTNALSSALQAPDSLSLPRCE